MLGTHYPHDPQTTGFFPCPCPILQPLGTHLPDEPEKKQDLDRLLLISFFISSVLAVGILLTSIVNIVKERRMLVERKKTQDERERLIAELQGALAQVKTLTGLLPICASCRKIRDDQGYWNQIEDYICTHSTATFSHGICPQCASKLYPEFFKNGHRL